jgi:hypothetical protein
MPQLIHNGRVLWHNNSPASGVRVRVLDRDASGTDDDLTTTEGVSNGDGYFSVTYDTDRFQDFVISRWETNDFVCDQHTDPVTGVKIPVNCRWEKHQHEERVPDLSDTFAPYLRLSYTVNNQASTGAYALLTAPIVLPETPANPPRAFRPSVDGFHFNNSFTANVNLPFPINGIRTLSRLYGLCGGMCAAAADYWKDPVQSIPATTTVPPNGSPLHQYLVQRQMDSFGPDGSAGAQFPVLMEMTNDGSNGLRARTRQEFGKLQTMFAQGIGAVPLGLIYVERGVLATNPEAVFGNHQVLATGVTCTLANQNVSIRIYDPNFSNNDAVVIQCTQVPPPSIAGFPGVNVRGFFVMPYAPKIPPPGL